jgi:two-component system chemotaxis sensor kinase CheA
MAADSAGTAIAQADTSLKPDDLPLVREFIAEAHEHIEAAERAILQLAECPSDIEAINALFRAFHTIKGVAGYLNLDQITALSHAAEGLLDLARNGRIHLAGGVARLVLEAVDALKALVELIERAVGRNAPLAKLASLPALLERLNIAASFSCAQPPPLPDAPPPTTAAKVAAAIGDGTVRVCADRLDLMINWVGELVLAHSTMFGDLGPSAMGNPALARKVSLLGQITGELRELAVSIRMLPMGTLFQKLARVARDVARKTGKDVEFATLGGDTELERNVIDAVSDPLIHMVRNCIDHGIEAPDQRVSAGKPRAGKVEIRVFRHAENVIIEIRDDGKGLDRDRIVRKAIETGILSGRDTPTQAEAFALIFHPGLSTAQKVTDISGRGVGMDVVRRNIQALRGTIDIASTPGQGSKFTIRLPARGL